MRLYIAAVLPNKGIVNIENIYYGMFWLFSRNYTNYAATVTQAKR